MPVSSTKVPWSLLSRNDTTRICSALSRPIASASKCIGPKSLESRLRYLKVEHFCNLRHKNVTSKGCQPSAWEQAKFARVPLMSIPFNATSRSDSSTAAANAVPPTPSSIGLSLRSRHLRPSPSSRASAINLQASSSISLSLASSSASKHKGSRMEYASCLTPFESVPPSVSWQVFILRTRSARHVRKA